MGMLFSDADIFELRHGKGWCIAKASDAGSLIQVCELLLELYSLRFRVVTDIRALRQDIRNINDEQLNELKISGSDLIPPLLVNTFAEAIKSVAGEQLFIQRRPTLMCNIPNRETTATLPHIDAMAGISPFAITIWVPLHNIQDDTGIYVIPQDRSIRLLEREMQKGGIISSEVVKPGNNNYIKMRYGEALFFNPFVMHGSTLNTNRIARISYNIRLQDQAHPLFFRNTDFYTCYNVSLPNLTGNAK